MTEVFKIDNVEFTFYYGSTDMVPENEDLGLSYLTIPGKMSDRFRRECGTKDTTFNYLVFPHYDPYDMPDIPRGSDHECYNSDTQIVLMNWLFNKKRQYRLEYQGLDPFWVFHDSFHAKNDVWGYEVQGIWSGIELERLFQGAEFAFSKGVTIKPETIAKLDAAWDGRWRPYESSGWTRFSHYEFTRFMNPEDVDLLEWYIEAGQFVQ